MSMEFGKLNFAVGFNRTSAFPLRLIAILKIMMTL